MVNGTFVPEFVSDRDMLWAATLLLDSMVSILDVTVELCRDGSIAVWMPDSESEGTGARLVS